MSMKVLGIIAAVVVIGGAAAFFMMNQSAGAPVPQAPAGEQGTQSSGESSEGMFSGSLADLVGRGGNWQCTFNVENEVSKSSGTVYVSGMMLRGDFESVVPQLNQTIDSHMIQKDGSVYVWTSLAPQGFKSAATIGTPDGTTAFRDQGVDINQTYNYNCTPWAVDASQFELPEGITFAGA
jgi:hypothetical protein